MRKHYLFSIINLILFISCNIIINFITGPANILFTIFFFLTWSLSLIGIYFILRDYVNMNKIGPLNQFFDYEDELIYNYITNDIKNKEIDDLLIKYHSKYKLNKYLNEKIIEKNNIEYKYSFFFSFKKEHITNVYFSYPVTIVMFLLGIICFISYFYFEKFSVIQYEYFTLLNGVILVSQIFIRFLIDLGIVRIKKI